VEVDLPQPRKGVHLSRVLRCLLPFFFPAEVRTVRIVDAKREFTTKSTKDTKNGIR